MRARRRLHASTVLALLLALGAAPALARPGGAADEPPEGVTLWLAWVLVPGWNQPPSLVFARETGPLRPGPATDGRHSWEEPWKYDRRRVWGPRLPAEEWWRLIGPTPPAELHVSAGADLAPRPLWNYAVSCGFGSDGLSDVGPPAVGWAGSVPLAFGARAAPGLPAPGSGPRTYVQEVVGSQRDDGQALYLFKALVEDSWREELGPVDELASWSRLAGRIVADGLRELEKLQGAKRALWEVHEPVAYQRSAQAASVLYMLPLDQRGRELLSDLLAGLPPPGSHGVADFQKSVAFALEHAPPAGALAPRPALDLDEAAFWRSFAVRANTPEVFRAALEGLGPGAVATDPELRLRLARSRERGLGGPPPGFVAPSLASTPSRLLAGALLGLHLAAAALLLVLFRWGAPPNGAAGLRWGKWALVAGLVLVWLDLRVHWIDVLPDAAGYALALWGAWCWRRTLHGGRPLLPRWAFAALAGGATAAVAVEHLPSVGPLPVALAEVGLLTFVVGLGIALGRHYSSVELPELALIARASGPCSIALALVARGVDRDTLLFQIHGLGGPIRELAHPALAALLIAPFVAPALLLLVLVPLRTAEEPPRQRTPWLQVPSFQADPDGEQHGVRNSLNKESESGPAS